MKLLNTKYSRWLIGFLAFIAIGAFSAILAELKIYQYEMSINNNEILQRYIRMWLKVFLWVIMGCTIYLMYKKFNFDTGKFVLSLAFHTIVSVLYADLHTYIYWGMIQSVISAGFYVDLISFEDILLISYRFNISIYWIILGFTIALDYFNKYKSRDKKAAELAKQLAETKLKVLQSQLQPHFLFNTLHNINGLIYEDKDAASKMITDLSDMLRMTLENKDENEISLKKEMELIEKYITIQSSRFKDKLETKIDIDNDVLDSKVPNMILQPLVENAFEHGLSKITKTGQLIITARSDNNNLVMEIHDNGNGINSNDIKSQKSGIGISNTKERLEQLYQDNFELIIDKSHLGGALIKLIIPLRSSKSESIEK